MAFTAELTCPGTTNNRIIIKTDLDLNTGGLNALSNSGTCTLYVGALDSSGHGFDNVALEPGGHVDHYQPPPGAASIYAVCHESCQGSAILNYDDPDLRA
jgi:hypothetical protein